MVSIMKNVYYVGIEKRAPQVSSTKEQDITHITLSGAWTVQTLASVLSEFYSITFSPSTSIRIDLNGVSDLDTAGALAINKWKESIGNKAKSVSISTKNQKFLQLLETSLPATLPEKKEHTKALPSLFLWFDSFGKKVVEFGHFSLSFIEFFGQFVVLFFSSIANPLRIRWTSLFFFIEQTGLRAVPIVSLLSFLIGVVVAYMCMDELAKFGAQSLSIKLLEVSMFREMGVLITAIVVAGRSSSSFTAQIGSMVANEEVAALRSMGLDPMPLLVFPRVVALMITLPMLVFIADIAGVIGGALAICPVQDIGFTAFLNQFYEGSKIWNFFVALIKAPFCALAIGLTGCYQGFQATTSAESVGFLTTVSVVQSIFLVIVIDAIFAIFFAGLGI